MCICLRALRGPRLLGLAWLLLAAGSVAAREVSMPLRFHNALVEKVLVEQIFTGPDRSLVALEDGSGCNYLILSDPHVSGVEGVLRVRSTARARVATAIGSQCLVLLEWSGFVETDQQAELDGERPRVMFRTVGSRLLDDSGAPATFTGTLWDWFCLLYTSPSPRD